MVGDGIRSVWLKSQNMFSLIIYRDTFAPIKELKLESLIAYLYQLNILQF